MFPAPVGQNINQWIQDGRSVVEKCPVPLSNAQDSNKFSSQQVANDEWTGRYSHVRFDTTPATEAPWRSLEAHDNLPIQNLASDDNRNQIWLTTYREVPKTRKERLTDSFKRAASAVLPSRLAPEITAPAMESIEETLIEGSPVNFRVTCLTNRSSYTSAAAKKSCARLSWLMPPDDSPVNADDNGSLPTVPGQRLIVNSPTYLTLREDLSDEYNYILSELADCEYVYFVRAGDGNRMKVQTICDEIGWVSWRNEVDDTGIFSICPKEV